jgi:hypothetical protein
MFADISLLDSLPNGGAVVAIIVVVMLFLRKIEQSEAIIKDITAAFVAETTAARNEYREHVSSIMSQGLEAHRETRDAIRANLADPRKPAEVTPKVNR